MLSRLLQGRPRSSRSRRLREIGAREGAFCYASVASSWSRDSDLACPTPVTDDCAVCCDGCCAVGRNKAYSGRCPEKDKWIRCSQHLALGRNSKSGATIERRVVELSFQV